MSRPEKPTPPPLQIPHRNGYSAYRAATATAMGEALDGAVFFDGSRDDCTYGVASRMDDDLRKRARFTKIDLTSAIKQHEDDARQLAGEFESLTARMVKAHAAKITEAVDQAVMRALEHTDNFEVHIYEWSDWRANRPDHDQHRVVFNSAVKIVVRSDGGAKIVHHPYGEEPIHDERRD